MGKVRASSYPYYDGLLVREHHLQLPEILPMLGCLTVSAAAAVAAEHAAVGAPRVLRRVPAGHVQLRIAKLRPGWYAHVPRLVAGLACCYEEEPSRPQAAERVLLPMLYILLSVPVPFFRILVAEGILICMAAATA
tara:strand:- start:464 stop:871 length:408 start_codon:yes stop_codon:yes gene_type:complete